MLHVVLEPLGLSVRITSGPSVLSFEPLSREIRSGCTGNLFYADDLALISESLEDLNGRLEALKWVESKLLEDGIDD